MKKISLLLLLLIVLFTSVISYLYFTSAPSYKLDIKNDFFYTSELFPIYKDFRKESKYVLMQDGTQIAIDIFIPVNGSGSGSFPVIFEYTPYGRSYIVPNMPLWQQIYSKIKLGISGPVYDHILSKNTRILLSQGYGYVVADMRGTGASSGSQMPLFPQIGKDGKEIIDWITHQNWSNGKVGMTGQSFVGWSQFITASYQPKGLKCIAPSCIMFETFTESTRPGGITSYHWLSDYSKLLEGVNTNKFDLNNSLWKFLPTTPVIDEDGDGDLEDEIPLSAKGDPSVFYDDLPFRYYDGNKRKNIYANNTLAHLKNYLAREMIAYHARNIDYKIMYQGDSISYYETSPGSLLNQIEEADIAVYNLGGWFDGFTKGTTKLFATLQGRTDDYLLIAPRFHRPVDIASPYKKYLGYQGNFEDQLIIEQLQFFNKYLKGRKVENLNKPVKIYTINKGWESFDTWPPKKSTLVKFSLNNNAKLSLESSDSSVTTYQVDYSLSSNYGSTDWNRWLLWGAPKEVMRRTKLDSTSLVYDSNVLDASIQITGHPIVNISLSSTQPNADVFVYLSDVDSNGVSTYITEGMLRSDWHNLIIDTVQVMNASKISPELPWHGYLKGEENLNALDSGKIIELNFDLMPTSWVIAKGHKIRVSLTGADIDNFLQHPSLSPNNNPKECPETVWSIYSTTENPSFIELPVIK